MWDTQSVYMLCIYCRKHRCDIFVCVVEDFFIVAWRETTFLKCVLSPCSHQMCCITHHRRMLFIGSTCVPESVRSRKWTLRHTKKHSKQDYPIIVTEWTAESKTLEGWWFVSHNSANSSPSRVEDEEVNQKRAIDVKGIQYYIWQAEMLMLPVSCQQDMKLYASWNHCSYKEVHLVPLLPYPIATTGNSPQHNSAGLYLDVVREL